jgi:N-acetylneuraminic acid mutarotase
MITDSRRSTRPSTLRRMRRLLLCLLAACGDDAMSIDAGTDANGSDGQVTTCAPSAGWVSAPAVGTGPTQETAVVAVGSKVYVIGGFDETLAVVRTIQVFDTQTCEWSLGPMLPQAVHHANAAVYDGRIYVLGAMEGLNFTTVGHVWSWTPGDTDWQVHTPMVAGQARGAGIVATIGDRIYLAGGLRNGSVAQLSSYDPATDTWDTSLPPLPVNRDHGCGGAIGGTLYATGGRATGIGALQGEVYAYTPGGAWESKAAMPTPRGGTACGVIGDRIVVVGGEGNGAVQSGVFPDVESYAPQTNTWTEHDPMVTPRHGMGAAAIGGSLYVPGGATVQAFGAVDTFEILTL